MVTMMIERTSAESTPWRLLAADLDRELRDRYPELELGDEPNSMEATGGEFFVGYLTGQPVACGGFRPTRDGAAEFKRMFVAATCRGAGLGRAMLEHLEVTARQNRFRRAVLRTGTRQERALKLYARSGWRRIEPFDDFSDARFSVWLAKTLVV